MNDRISGGSLYPYIQLGQFRFLNVLYRVIQTKLLQEPVLAQCGGVPPLSAKGFLAPLTDKIR